MEQASVHGPRHEPVAGHPQPPRLGLAAARQPVNQAPGTGRGPGGTANAAAGPVTGTVIQAGMVSGGVHIQAAPPGYQVPLARQFPPGPAILAGRAAELGILDDLLGARPAGPVIAVLSGVAGIGKTALALSWLHAHCSQFGDGHLHADLADTGGGGELPGDVLGRWLRALGVPAEWIPSGVPELAAMWRSVTAGRPLAVLVENPGTVGSVRQLLPGRGPGVVVVTSRQPLQAFAGTGARFVHLGPLPEDAAVTLLSHIAGAGRVEAEPAEARRLVTACGNIPLAVCTAAGQLALAPCQPIAAAGQAARPKKRKETPVRARLDAAYAALDPGTARGCRLLSLHPGPHLGTQLSAAILNSTASQAETVLGVLVTGRLLEPAAHDRYRFHDQTRHHLRSLARHEDAAAVTGRIAGWYLHQVLGAGKLLQPYRHPARDPGPPPAPGLLVTWDSVAGCLDWLEAERGNLTAVVRAAGGGHPATSWQLADAMWPLFLYRGHARQQLSVYRAGLGAARVCGDLEGQARMLDLTGIACRNLGRHGEAALSFEDAGLLWRALGNDHKVTGTTRRLGWIAEARGNHEEAITLYRQALDGYRAHGSARHIALTLIDLGDVLTAAGQAEQAAAVLTEADHLGGDLDPYNAARARAALGRALADGSPAQAGILQALARIADRAGDPGTARGYWEQALGLLPPGHPQVPVIRTALTGLEATGPGSG